MLNIQELEKRWLKYKIKTYFPYAVIFISLTVIITIISIFATSNVEKTPVMATKPKKHEKKKIVAIQSPQKEQNISTQKKSTTTQIQTVTSIEDTKLTLSPSINFMKHTKNIEQQPYYKVTSSVKKSTKKREKIVQQASIEEEYMDLGEENQIKKKTIKKESALKPYKKQTITIERRDSQNDIKKIIARFKKSNNPALSLFVAKKYYELGNYEQAYNYALITNAINNDIEDSWLVFTKSLVKLNKKNMAIRTLMEYIKYSHSGSARILLDDIQSGKFK